MSPTTGDTRPDLTGTCKTTDPVTGVTTAVNLSGAALELHIRRADGTTLTKVGTIVSAAAGTWKYVWQTGDLATGSAGTWSVEVQVVYSDGGIQTFGPSRFAVSEQLA